MGAEAPLRAGDQDRHEAVLALSDEFAEGRLDRDEFDRRQAIALEATYLHDLDPLFADLPGRVAPTSRTTARSPALVPTRSAPPPAALAAFALLSALGSIALVALAVGSVVSGHLLWLLVPFAAFVIARRARRRAYRYAIARQALGPGYSPFVPPHAFAHGRARGPHGYGGR